jgi:multidrug efflux pump subunit AcrB
MLVTIGLVYMIMVILFGSLLVPFVILSVLIGLLMLIDIVVINATVLLDLAVATNAIVLLDLVQHKIEAGADVRTALMQRYCHPYDRCQQSKNHDRPAGAQDDPDARLCGDGPRL